MNEAVPQSEKTIERVRQLVAAAPVLRTALPPVSEEFEGEAFPRWVRTLKAWQPRTLDLNAPPREVVHAVHQIIRPAKVGALVAAGGTGKTTVLIWLAVAHATGRKFLGQAVQTGTFVLLSNDDPQEDLDAALENVVRTMKLSAAELAQVEARVRLHSLQGEKGMRVFTASAGGSVTGTDLQDLLVEAVRGIPDLIGLALDTLRQFSGGSSNDEQVIKLTIAGATEFAMRTGAYVVLPHHTGKQNYRDGVADMYCGSGSAAIADNCRFVLLLQTATWPDIENKVQRTGQESGEPFVLTSTRGSLLMRPAPPIFFYRREFFLDRIAGAVLTRDQQADEADRKVLRAIRRGAQTKNAIVGVVGGRKSAAIDRVDDLEARRLIENRRSHSGARIKAAYVVTALGGQHLEAHDE